MILVSSTSSCCVFQRQSAVSPLLYYWIAFNFSPFVDTHTVGVSVCVCVCVWRLPRCHTHRIHDTVQWLAWGTAAYWMNWCSLLTLWLPLLWSDWITNRRGGSESSERLGLTVEGAFKGSRSTRSEGRIGSFGSERSGVCLASCHTIHRDETNPSEAEKQMVAFAFTYTNSTLVMIYALLCQAFGGDVVGIYVLGPEL